MWCLVCTAASRLERKRLCMRLLVLLQQVGPIKDAKYRWQQLYRRWMRQPRSNQKQLKDCVLFHPPLPVGGLRKDLPVNEAVLLEAPRNRKGDRSKDM